MKRWKKKKSRIIGGGIALLIVWYIFCLPRQLFHVPYSTVVADRHHELLGARIAPDGQWRFPPRTTTPEKIKTIQYFDVVNFARQVKVPGFYIFGYNDRVCPPTTTYSTYNVINAPKELFVAETTAHYAYAEQWSAAWNWVMNFLKNKSK